MCVCGVLVSVVQQGKEEVTEGGEGGGVVSVCLPEE